VFLTEITFEKLDAFISEIFHFLKFQNCQIF